MATLKLTDRGLKSLRTKKAQEDYFDRETRGFGVRVSAEGRRTFFVRYRVDGRRPRLWLGTYPAVSLAEARLRATECLVEVARGGDPQAERQEARRAPTFADLASEYMRLHSKRKKRSWRGDQRILDVDLLPVWGGRKAHEIGARDIVALLDRIVERGAPMGANRTRALVSTIFNFGIGRGIVQTNPVVGVPTPAIPRRRDRVLSDEEIVAVWRSTFDLAPAMGATYRFRLLTAQRGGEVLTMRWSDLQEDWWTIPAERSKNGLEHRVPLVGLAQSLLSEMREIADSPEWVFTSARCRGRRIVDVKQATRRLVGWTGAHFVPHDLRRTAASRMASIGVQPHVIAKILNHTDSSVTAVYNRYSYDREKREALTLWSRHLESLLPG